MEYDLSFAARLADVADDVVQKAPYAHDARRLVAYLSRLSVEIALKALLEHAGKPIKEIRGRSHNLRALLSDLTECEVQVEVSPGTLMWVSAARLRAISVDLGVSCVPIGDLITAENSGASTYPNKIRYGETVIDMPPSLLASMAICTVRWAQDHCSTIRLR